MRVRKLDQLGVSHYVLPVIVVLVVGLIGVKVLTDSHAQTPITVLPAASSQIADTYRGAAILGPQEATPGVQSVQSSAPYSFIGNQTVDSLAPGDTLSYTQGIKGDETSCYEVYVQQPKVGNATITAEFANNNNYFTKTLTSNSSNNLQQVCVAPGTKTNPGFEVKNTTPLQQNTNLEVYEDIITWL